MKKFYFRLSTPLRIKKLRENIEKQKLAEAVIEKDKAENRLVELEVTKKNTLEGIKKRLSTSVETKVLSDYDVFAAEMISLIDMQKDIINQVSEVYEKRRLSFLDHRRERDIYEKIKEKSYNDYNKKMNKEEQKIIDELANINHSRLERDVLK
jgi:flagellar FliJ protein